MEYKDKKYILKKLMQDALTEEERIALQSSRRVTKEMERQWNNAPDAVESDRPDEPSIWRNICKEVWQHDEGRNVVFYKIYSMVASILLVLGVAGTVYFALQDKANWMPQTGKMGDGWDCLFCVAGQGECPNVCCKFRYPKYGICLFTRWNESADGTGQPLNLSCQFFR